MMVLAAAATLMAVLSAFGLLAVAAGAIAVHRFARRSAQPLACRPAVTVLKPLCGDEPMLEAALATICRQDYPAFQVVFGLQDPSDPALAIVRRLQARFPACDIAVVVNTAWHGPNRKIGNLINMLPSARHDLLVFSDSDLHVPANYLDRILAALETPGTGLVTTVCAGLPTTPGIAARLGGTGITHSFLPSAILSRLLGREDCLGTTMALRRSTLTQIGGLGALVRHLADDNVLGRRVKDIGLRVGLACTVPMTAVPEKSLRALWQHELRWARTIRALEPILFATSTLYFPLFWAWAAILLSAEAKWSLEFFAFALLVRTAAARWTDRALNDRRTPVPFWMFPLRDVLSVSQVAVSYLGARVVWRGHVMRADDGLIPVPSPEQGLSPAASV